MATKTMTPPDQWLAADPNYIPHYSHTQQIMGAIIFVTILLIATVTFILIHIRRR
jgi:hypothetical protein